MSGADGPTGGSPGSGPSAVCEERPAETTARLRPIKDDSRPGSGPARAAASSAMTPAAGVPIAAFPGPTGTTSTAATATHTVDRTPGPGAGRPFTGFAQHDAYNHDAYHPDVYDDDTTRLRPIRARSRPRAAAAAVCAVLGLGLIGGAVTGSWLTGDSSAAAGSENSFAAAGDLWHSVPVDRLFPPVVKGDGAGPGGADRVWTRIAVAPDTGCKTAFDPLLRKALAPVGCLRLLRATYTDATRSDVTTVGLLFTKADADGMRALHTRFEDEGLDRREDLMPRPYGAKGTVADDFGDDQRASWTVSVLTDAPVVVYAVSGFADGRTVEEPQPAADAMKAGATTAPAQAGLGYEAKGLADRIERSLRKTVTAATEKPS
ncbi:hypothetical protein ABT009_05930 [Streptomyces sp. NPDC002896]|uniref:hypothetical protein n=1 Tax=Streptomyces sp. NPDC002896 TaxID=3154438 RepID=UPI00331B67DA